MTLLKTCRGLGESLGEPAFTSAPRASWRCEQARDVLEQLAKQPLRLGVHAARLRQLFVKLLESLV